VCVPAFDRRKLTLSLLCCFSQVKSLPTLKECINKAATVGEIVCPLLCDVALLLFSCFCILCRVGQPAWACGGKGPKPLAVARPSQYGLSILDSLTLSRLGVCVTGLAEKCLASFMHPLPATLLGEALDVAKEVGPPVCQKSYMGSACAPEPDPVAHGGSCPQGFMCMPDPSQCTSCACSCNSPADKLATFETCVGKAKSSEAGSFCLTTLFTQLPPSFVEQAIEKANQPAGASEHYTQIFSACGGGENGTAIVSSCLEQVEYCVRPIQGHPGTFPEDYSKFQSLCECFRKPEVLAMCGPEDDEEIQTSCSSAIRDHYVMHVHHQYCLHNTEAACEFECKWPLPGFFGGVDKAAH